MQSELFRPSADPADRRDAEKIIPVGFPQVEGYPVYVVLFDNSGTHSVHDGVSALHLLHSYAVYINFKVGHEPGEIRIRRQFT